MNQGWRLQKFDFVQLQVQSFESYSFCQVSQQLSCLDTCQYERDFSITNQYFHTADKWRNYQNGEKLLSNPHMRPRRVGDSHTADSEPRGWFKGHGCNGLNLPVWSKTMLILVLRPANERQDMGLGGKKILNSGTTSCWFRIFNSPWIAAAEKPIAFQGELKTCWNYKWGNNFNNQSCVFETSRDFTIRYYLMYKAMCMALSWWDIREHFRHMVRH